MRAPSAEPRARKKAEPLLRGLLFGLRAFCLCALSAAVAPSAHAQDAGEEPSEDLSPAAAAEAEATAEAEAEAAADQGEAAEGEEQTGPILWRPEWRRYGVEEGVFTAALGGTWIAELLFTFDETPRWTATNDFDDGVREGLMIRDAEGREIMSRVSDVMVGALLFTPLLVQPLLLAGVARGDWDSAWQLSLLALEAFAINNVLTESVKIVASRTRPVGRACAEGAPTHVDDPICDEPPPPVSFFSGHTSNAFTGASLICLYHTELGLLGSGWDDALACAAGMAAAASVGLMRIAADKHYFSDVLVGAAAGLFSGYLIPYLLHFTGGGRPDLPDLGSVSVMPYASAQGAGLSATGLW